MLVELALAAKRCDHLHEGSPVLELGRSGSWLGSMIEVADTLLYLAEKGHFPKSFVEETLRIYGAEGVLWFPFPDSLGSLIFFVCLSSLDCINHR